MWFERLNEKILNTEDHTWRWIWRWFERLYEKMMFNPEDRKDQNIQHRKILMRCEETSGNLVPFVAVRQKRDACSSQNASWNAHNMVYILYTYYVYIYIQINKYHVYIYIIICMYTSCSYQNVKETELRPRSFLHEAASKKDTTLRTTSHLVMDRSPS